MPVLQYASYLGGTGTDDLNDACFDPQGAAFLLGTTSSTDFPNISPNLSSLDTPVTFVRKLAPLSHRLEWQFTLRRTLGWAVFCDAQGDLYFTGTAYTNTLPTTPGAFRPAPLPTAPGGLSAFVGKLSGATGTPLYLTYLDAQSGASGKAIAANAKGEAWIAGSVSASAGSPSHFPIVPANAPNVVSGNGAFLAKLDANGSHLLISELLGGDAISTNVGLSSEVTLVLDSNSDVYLAGDTPALNFPTTANAPQPGFPGHSYYRSMDAGAHWTALDTLPGIVANIKVSPADHQTIYASTSRGFYVSTDAGLTWNQQYPIGYGNEFLLLSPLDPKLIYTAYSYSDQIEFSRDGGLTWNLYLPPNIPGISQVGTVYTIAFDETNPTHLLIGSSGGYYTYDTSFANAYPVRASIYTSPVAFAFDHSTSPATLLIGSFEGIHRINGATDVVLPLSQSLVSQSLLAVGAGQTPVYYAGNATQPYQSGPGHIWRSLDRGMTWTDISRGLPNYNVALISPDPLLPTTVYVSTISGLFRSDDAGDHWQYAPQSLANPRVQTLDFATPASGNAVQLAGSLYEGSGFLVKADGTSGNLLFSTYVGGSGGEPVIGLAVDSNHLYVSVDSWSQDFAARRLPGTGPTVGHCALQQRSTDGTQVQAAVTFGGSLGPDLCNRFVRNPATGDLLFAGYTYSTDLPVTANAPEQHHAGGTTDGFLVQLPASLTGPVFSTYVGGSLADTVTALAIWPATSEILIGGVTNSPDLPASRGTEKAAPNSPYGVIGDAFFWLLHPQSGYLQLLERK